MPAYILGVLQGEFVKWHWNEDELEMQWSLSVEESALLPGRTDSGRLGFAILLKFFQFQGFFPDSQKGIPHEIAVYLAHATNSAVADLDIYEWDGRTPESTKSRQIGPLTLHLELVVMTGYGLVQKSRCDRAGRSRVELRGVDRERRGEDAVGRTRLIDEPGRRRFAEGFDAVNSEIFPWKS